MVKKYTISSMSNKKRTMERRNFIKSLGFASASFPLMSFSEAKDKIENKQELIKPKALKKGDTIGLITPGSFIEDEGLAKAIENIKSLGFKVKLSKNIRKQRGYTAGTRQERINDLHTMFTDSDIDGIWCARGGYGCTGLLPLIDFDLIKNNPKVFIGYSDITVLHLAIFKKAGLVTFHGPVASSVFSEYSTKYFKKMLMSTNIPPKVYPSEYNDEKGKENVFFKPKVINKGEAEGKLIGGNLSLISAMAGTEWAINYEDKLLFIEDIGEAPYRIDRMLIQINQNQSFNKANGIILGVFEDCKKPEDEPSLELVQMFDDNMQGVSKPAAYGFSIGHIRDQFTLPMGIKAKMNAEERTLEFLENAVV